MDSTIAAEPATFWAMSWMTVKVVTTRSGFFACARAPAGTTMNARASASVPWASLLMTMRGIPSENAFGGSIAVHHTRNRSQLATANRSQLESVQLPRRVQARSAPRAPRSEIVGPRRPRSAQEPTQTPADLSDPALGYAGFCAVNLAGYSLAGSSVAELPKPGRRCAAVGATRTLIDMVAGALYFGLR